MSPDNSSSERSLADMVQWVQKNSRVVSLAGTVIVVAVLGSYLFIRSNQIKADRAESAYNESQQLMYMGKNAEGSAKMAEVADRYAGTNGGTMAAMRLAAVNLNDRKLADAIRILKEAQPKANDKLFGSAIHGLLAGAYSDSGLYVEAGDEYVRAAQSTRVLGDKAGFNFQAGEMFAQAGSKDRAISLLKEVAEGPESVVRGKARKLLGELTTSPAKVGGTG